MIDNPLLFLFRNEINLTKIYIFKHDLRHKKFFGDFSKQMTSYLYKRKIKNCSIIKTKKKKIFVINYI